VSVLKLVDQSNSKVTVPFCIVLKLVYLAIKVIP